MKTVAKQSHPMDQQQSKVIKSIKPWKKAIDFKCYENESDFMCSNTFSIYANEQMLKKANKAIKKLHWCVQTTMCKIHFESVDCYCCCCQLFSSALKTCNSTDLLRAITEFTHSLHSHYSTRNSSQLIQFYL